jgi:predicted signal transduction protein with EAL and GGDEF domain
MADPDRAGRCSTSCTDSASGRRRPEHRLQLTGLPRHLPADELKLDRSLTSDADTDPRAGGHRGTQHRPGPPTGAAPGGGRCGGRGTGAALALLCCDVAQGYAIARPMPVEDFLESLATPRPFLLDQTQT